MKDSATSHEDEAFFQQVSKGGSWFIILVIGGFSLLFAIAGASHFPRSRADDWALLGLGVMGLFVAWRLYLFLFKARMLITMDALIVRNFLNARRVRLGDIVSLGAYTKTFRPRAASGRSMRYTLTTEHVVIRLRSGKEVTYTLPSFGNNARLITVLESRTGNTVERLPDIDKT